MFSPRLREERAYSSLDKLQMHCPIDIVGSSCVSLSCCCIQSIVGAKNAKVQKYKMTKIQIARPALSYCGIQLGRSQFWMSHKACWHSTHRGKVSIQQSEGLHQWKYQNFWGQTGNPIFTGVTPLGVSDDWHGWGPDEGTCCNTAFNWSLREIIWTTQAVRYFGKTNQMLSKTETPAQL